tara:strand:- start:233 stop:514 length:282 start_codon:yes stop_codon:yes gene_type:complete
MGIKALYTTQSIAQHESFPQLFKLSLKTADEACLCRGEGATRCLFPQMSNQGRALLNKRKELLKATTTPDERQAVYHQICNEARQIVYGFVGA